MPPALPEPLPADLRPPNSGERWTAERARAWYAAQPFLLGANYIPSDAINQLEMFQPSTWNPALIDRELALAASIGMNTLRVFLHDLLWLDRAALLQRVDQFLSIAASHRIRPLLVLFDSCWDPGPRLGPQPKPRPGIHNSGWLQSPGAHALADSSTYPRLADYITGIVRAFAADPRILAWDLWNEPDNFSPRFQTPEPKNKTALVVALLPEVFRWARLANPTQPLTSGVWEGDWRLGHRDPTVEIQLTQSDIISFHQYGWPEDFEDRLSQLTPLDRPILCTEYMARGAGSTFDTILPICRARHVAAINWGLVNGKTQTHLPWDSWDHPYTDRKPTIWFHDLFHPDGKPYRQREIDLLLNRAPPP